MHRFVTAFQSVTPLTIGELWAWPSALKLALVEHLRVRADVLAERRRHQRHADRLVRRARDAVAANEPFPAEVHSGVRHPAAAALARVRRRGRGAAARARRRARRQRARPSRTPSAAEGRHQAAEQAAMANLIGSLRLISTFDWSEFFESVSLVEQVLQRDPAGVYGRMDFRSRDRYRHAVEELAEPTGDGQLRVALKSVERARQIGARTPDERGAHVGYHLIGRGRRAFEQSVGWVPNLHGARPAPVLSVGDALAISARSRWARRCSSRGHRLRRRARLARRRAGDSSLLLTAIPASELTIQILQRIISYLDPAAPAAAARARSVPASARTMVIVPTILDGVERVARAPRPPRGPGARQRRSAHPLRGPERLP